MYINIPTQIWTQSLGECGPMLMLFTYFILWFGGHPWWCSGLTSGLVLRDHSWPVWFCIQLPISPSLIVLYQALERSSQLGQGKGKDKEKSEGSSWEVFSED